MVWDPDGLLLPILSLRTILEVANRERAGSLLIFWGVCSVRAKASTWGWHWVSWENNASPCTERRRAFLEDKEQPPLKFIQVSFNETSLS